MNQFEITVDCKAIKSLLSKIPKPVKNQDSKYANYKVSFIYGRMFITSDDVFMRGGFSLDISNLLEETPNCAFYIAPEVLSAIVWDKSISTRLLVNLEAGCIYKDDALNTINPITPTEIKQDGYNVPDGEDDNRELPLEALRLSAQYTSKNGDYAVVNLNETTLTSTNKFVLCQQLLKLPDNLPSLNIPSKFLLKLGTRTKGSLVYTGKLIVFRHANYWLATEESDFEFPVNIANLIPNYGAGVDVVLPQISDFLKSVKDGGSSVVKLNQSVNCLSLSGNDDNANLTLVIANDIANYEMLPKPIYLDFKNILLDKLPTVVTLAVASANPHTKPITLEFNVNESYYLKAGLII